MGIGLVIGMGLALWGCYLAAWAIREAQPGSMVLHGVIVIELGLMFLAQGLLQPGLMRDSMVGAFAVSGLVSVWSARKLQRAERRNDPNRSEGNASE